MNKLLRIYGSRTVLIIFLTAFPGIAGASDWLSLQGLEPDGAGSMRLWGFIQAQYQVDYGDPNANGEYVPAKLIGPDLDSQSAFNINRARLGARGVATPLDSKINYSVLVELGNNGITATEGPAARLTDASLTFSHIKGANVRAGLFKYPGAEEGLQAIHVFDYINYTFVTNQMLLERIPNRKFTPNIGARSIPPEDALNDFDESVGAFRDVGIQVFNTFKLDQGWELSYAGMLGNGNGLSFNDNDDNKDLYFYIATEKVYDGKGVRRSGLKFFAWSQRGKRTADLTDDSIHNPAEYDRNRSGLGVKYLRSPWRLTAEYMRGRGMIFQGPHNPSWGIGPGAGNPANEGNGAYARADGWYIDSGFRLPGTKWEIDLRYDGFNRLDGDRFEAKFSTATVGAQYFFHPRVRVAFNYAMARAEAPEFPPGAGPNANLDGIGNRISIQLTGIFTQ